MNPRDLYSGLTKTPILASGDAHIATMHLMNIEVFGD